MLILKSCQPGAMCHAAWCPLVQREQGQGWAPCHLGGSGGRGLELLEASCEASSERETESHWVCNSGTLTGPGEVDEAGLQAALWALTAAGYVLVHV